MANTTENPLGQPMFPFQGVNNFQASMPLVGGNMASEMPQGLGAPPAGLPGGKGQTPDLSGFREALLSGGAGLAGKPTGGGLAGMGTGGSLGTIARQPQMAEEQPRQRMRRRRRRRRRNQGSPLVEAQNAQQALNQFMPGMSALSPSGMPLGGRFGGGR